MESKFDYKIKRHLPICEYEKLWKILTVICAVAVYVIIKGSTAPLIIDNAFFRILFYSDPEGDKTFYNIAISIVAAYIFYLLQVYLPERSYTNRALTVTALDSYNLVHQLKRFLFIWDELTEKTSDGAIMCKKVDSIYYKGVLHPEVISEGNAEELKLTEGRIRECYEAIIQNKEFQRIDVAVYRLFTQIDLAKEVNILRMAMIGAEKSSEHCATLFETYSPETVKAIESTIAIIGCLYGFTNIDQFSITTDAEEIKAWKEREAEMYAEILKNKDFINSLPQEYKDSLR